MQVRYDWWRARVATRRGRLAALGLGLAGVCIAVGVWLVATGGASPAGRDEVYERVRASGSLRVCLDASFPPFESIGAGETIVGFDADLAQEIARRLNVQAQFVNTGFDSLYAELTAKHCDAIISALPFDRMRTHDFAYSDIYFRGGEVLVVRSTDAAIAKLSDLAGKMLGVELGTSAEALAQSRERRNGYQVRSYTTLEEAARGLEAGEVRGVLADAVSARLLLRARAGLLIAGEPVGDEPNYVIAMPLNAGSLLAAVNTQLRALTKDGTLKRLVDKWF